jgi:hypothetical protein
MTLMKTHASIPFPGPWAAERLALVNALITSTKLVRELDPDGKTVWVLDAWEGAVNLGPSTAIQLLDTPSVPEDVHFGEFR